MCALYAITVPIANYVYQALLPAEGTYNHLRLFIRMELGIEEGNLSNVVKKGKLCATTKLGGKAPIPWKLMQGDAQRALQAVVEDCRLDIKKFFLETQLVQLKLFRDENVEDVIFDPNYWETKPKIISWAEASQDMTRIKMQKIQEGKVAGPYGQTLLSPERPNVLMNGGPPATNTAISNNTNAAQSMPSENVFSSFFEAKNIEEMITMKISADELGPRTMEAITARLQSLLLQKVTEVCMIL